MAAKGSHATFEHWNLEVTGKIKHPKQQIVQGKEQSVDANETTHLGFNGISIDPKKKEEKM